MVRVHASQTRACSCCVQITQLATKRAGGSTGSSGPVSLIQQRHARVAAMSSFYSGCTLLHALLDSSASKFRTRCRT